MALRILTGETLCQLFPYSSPILGILFGYLTDKKEIKCRICPVKLEDKIFICRFCFHPFCIKHIGKDDKNQKLCVDCAFVENDIEDSMNDHNQRPLGDILSDSEKETDSENEYASD
jgi:hypothetical protein